MEPPREIDLQSCTRAEVNVVFNSSIHIRFDLIMFHLWKYRKVLRNYFASENYKLFLDAETRIIELHTHKEGFLLQSTLG